MAEMPPDKFPRASVHMVVDSLLCDPETYAELTELAALLDVPDGELDMD